MRAVSCSPPSSALTAPNLCSPPRSRRIGTCRKKVMGLLRLMGNKADVVKGLSKRCNENWSVAPKSDIVRFFQHSTAGPVCSRRRADRVHLPQGLYLSDIQDHITTSTQNLTHYEKILSRSHSNYLAQISIEMWVSSLALLERRFPLTCCRYVTGPTPTTRSTTSFPS